MAPLPMFLPDNVRSNPAHMVGYYSSPGSQYTGRPSDNQSLSIHERNFYAQARLANLTADLALAHVISMFEVDSLAGSFYFF